MKESFAEPIQQAREKLGEAARWTAPVIGDALNQEAGINVYSPGNGPELTIGQEFGSDVAQFTMRRAAERLKERFSGKPEAQAADASTISSEAGQSFFMTAKDKTSEFVSWLKPVAADALKRGTGIDTYDFLGKEQPELQGDQKFASGALRVAAGIAAARLAQRRAAS